MNEYEIFKKNYSDENYINKNKKKYKTIFTSFESCLKE